MKRDSALDQWSPGREDGRASGRCVQSRDRRSRFARGTRESVRRRCRRGLREEGVRELGLGVDRKAHPRAVRLPRTGREAPRRSRADAHARTRQSALGCDRRGAARSRSDRVRVRHRRPDEGRLLGERLDRSRLVLDPPAARRRRGHHAVQLPGDGPDVDVPDRDRVREHVRVEAQRARSVASRISAPNCCRRPACPKACSTSCTATRSRSIACSNTPTSPPSASSDRRPSRATSTKTARATASVCRRSAARRTTWWCSPTRTWTSRRTRQ